MTKEIKLTQGKVALVDDEDYEWLNQWKWFAHRGAYTYYAMRNSIRESGKQTTVQMHRFILNVPDEFDVDHRDKNGLNNTRENIRKCTRSENQNNRGKQKNNTSGYKGVSWLRTKWMAGIRVGKKRIHLGYFESAEDAARAYDEAARKHHREFANLNFPK